MGGLPALDLQALVIGLGITRLVVWYLWDRWWLPRAAKHMAAKMMREAGSKEQGRPATWRGSKSLRPLLVAVLFVTLGIWLIARGNSSGWFAVIFFGLCVLVFVLEPFFPKREISCLYRLLINEDEVACEHPQRKRESVRWDEVQRIWFITNSAGPWLPDQWFLFEGRDGGCSFPTEAEGIKGIWEELERRFAGFDFKPVIRAGTDDAKYLCWEKSGLTRG